MRHGIAGSLTTLTILLLCTGCATVPKIPLGEWEGHGVFVISKWGNDDKSSADAGLKTAHGGYPTWLKIERAEGDDHDGVRIEILSQRGKTTLLEGDRTHLIAVLRPAEPLSDNAITLYRLAEFGVSTDASPPSPDEGPEGRTYASCMLADDEVVLRVHYMDEFVDTLWFRGDSVLKDGSYFDSKSGLIHWSERLRRKR